MTTETNMPDATSATLPCLAGFSATLVEWRAAAPPCLQTTNGEDWMSHQ